MLTEKIKQFYSKYKKGIENLLFPCVLVLYALMNLFQGVDVTDTTYSLGNFLYFERMEGMWVISTYLSNVTGYLLTRLPFGETLPGMNFYTGLILCILVLFAYFTLKKIMPGLAVFTGEVLAIGFCWIPTAILYNYLTYLLFAAGLLLLYMGTVKSKNIFLFGAGICLGLNTMVRIPNLTECALILGLWLYLFLKKEKLPVILKKTGICILGYLIGFGIPFLAVLIQYGFGSFLKMIESLSAIKEVDATYSPLSMVTRVISAYAHSFKWFLILVLGFIGAGFLFSLMKEKLLVIKKLLCLLEIVLIIRFFWGRGMFTFRYYEDYTSMYEWGMIGLFLSLVACMVMLFCRHYTEEQKLLALLSLLVLVVTPLGSNNYTCQNLNNLFIVAPVTVWFYASLMLHVKKENAFTVRAFLIAVFGMILVQSIGFHCNFVFRDGMQGEKRTATVTETASADGMKTNPENAETLMGISRFCRENGLTGQDTLFFGNVPGLSFLLKMPFAISSAWPDLDSYSVTQMEEEMEAYQTIHNTDIPVIITAEVENPSKWCLEKEDILLDYISQRHYTMTYSNEKYKVYVPQE